MAGSRVGVVGGGEGEGERCCEGGGEGGGDRGDVQTVAKGSVGEVGEKGRPVVGVGGRRVRSTLQSVVKLKSPRRRICSVGPIELTSGVSRELTNWC